MYEKGQTIEVEITDAAEGNECFGRLDDGMSVLVYGVLAVGDRVEAEVRRKRKKYLKAGLRRVIRPSPHRVEPPCPYFGTCGGCKWQHVTYEEQLRVKRKQVADALAHLGGFAEVEVDEPIPSPRPLGYRNKVDFTFGERRFLLPGDMEGEEDEIAARTNRRALGFHAPRVYSKVIDIEACLLASPAMNRALALVRDVLEGRRLKVYSTKTHVGFLRHLVVREARATGEVMVNLITSYYEEGLMRELDARLRERMDAPYTLINGLTDRKSMVAFGDREEVISGRGTITEKLGPFSFVISANSFFQTHTEQALALYREAVRLAAPEPGHVVYDLYCGTGSISMFLAQRAGKVLGIEAIESAVRDAEANAARNGVGHGTFRQMDLRDLGQHRPGLEAFGLPEVVVTDPPRAGMHPKAIETLRSLAPRRIVYVSCKPASLARDARMLCEGGLYRLAAVRPVDMFPQTAHVESVALLERGRDATRSAGPSPADAADAGRDRLASRDGLL